MLVTSSYLPLVSPSLPSLSSVEAQGPCLVTSLQYPCSVLIRSHAFKFLTSDLLLCVQWECLASQSCPELRQPMDCSLQTPLSMGCSRREYWSGLPFPSLVYADMHVNTLFFSYEAVFSQCDLKGPKWRM